MELAPKIPLLELLSSRRMRTDVRQREAIDGGMTGPFYPDTDRSARARDARFGEPELRRLQREELAFASGRTFFVNGIQNSFAEHWDHCQRLAIHLQRPVLGIYNQSAKDRPDSKAQRVAGTLGMAARFSSAGNLMVPMDEMAVSATSMIQDLYEASEDHGGDEENPALRTAENLIDRRPSGRFVGHSQGSLILLGSLKNIARRSPKKLTKALEIDFIGSQVERAPIGPSYLRLLGTHDLAAMAPETLFRAINYVKGEDGKDEGQDYLTEVTTMLEGFGHDAEAYMTRLPQRHGDKVMGTRLGMSKAHPLYGPLGALVIRKIWTWVQMVRQAAIGSWHLLLKGGRFVRDKYQQGVNWFKGKLRTGIKWFGDRAIAPLADKLYKNRAAMGGLVKSVPLIGEQAQKVGHGIASWTMANRKRIGGVFNDLASIMQMGAGVLGVVGFLGFVFGGPAVTFLAGSGATILTLAGIAAKTIAATFVSLGAFAGEEDTGAYDLLADAGFDAVTYGVGKGMERVDSAAKVVKGADFDSVQDMFAAKNIFDKLANIYRRVQDARGVVADVSKTGKFAGHIVKIDKAYKIFDFVKGLLDNFASWADFKKAWNRTKTRVVNAGKFIYDKGKYFLGLGLRKGKQLLTTGVAKARTFGKSLYKSAGSFLTKATTAVKGVGHKMWEGLVDYYTKHPYPVMGGMGMPVYGPMVQHQPQKSGLATLTHSPSSLLTSLASVGNRKRLDSEQQRTLHRGGIDFDLSRVSIFSDPAASGAATAIGARAFTIGSNIFFGQGHFSPSSPEGQALLAHELTHVGQQASGKAGTRGLDALEAEAQQVEQAFLHSPRTKSSCKELELKWELDGALEPSDQRELEEVRTLLLDRVESRLEALGLNLDLDTVQINVDLDLERFDADIAVNQILDQIEADLSSRAPTHAPTRTLQLAEDDGFNRQVSQDHFKGSLEMLLGAAKVVGGMALMGTGAPLLVGGALTVWGLLDLLQEGRGAKRMPENLLEGFGPSFDGAIAQPSLYFGRSSSSIRDLFTRGSVLPLPVYCPLLPYPSPFRLPPTVAAPAKQARRDETAASKSATPVVGKGLRSDISVDDSSNLADWDFIEKEEKISDTGYILARAVWELDPVTKKRKKITEYRRVDNSQVTIANGLDLGVNGANISDLKISKALMKKLKDGALNVPAKMTPEEYNTYKARAAKLVLSDGELREIIAATRARTEKYASHYFDKASDTDLKDQPDAARTVVTDLFHQYGNAARNRKSVKLIEENKYSEAADNLEAQTDYISRNKARADMLRSLVKKDIEGAE